MKHSLFIIILLLFFPTLAVAQSSEQSSDTKQTAPRSKTPKMESEGSSASEPQRSKDEARIEYLMNKGYSSKQIIDLMVLEKQTAEIVARDKNSETFIQGEEVFLISPSPSPRVIAYDSEETFQKAAENWKTVNHARQMTVEDELARLQKTFSVPSGTKVSVIGTSRVEVMNKTYDLVRVKILETAFTGKTVWVQRIDLRHELKTSYAQ